MRVFRSRASVGAEVVALYVTQPFAATIGFDGMAAAYAITDEDYEKASAEQADKYLKQITDRADTAGVKSESRAVSNFNVADGIVQAAADQGCDLIFIGSHGRSGLSRLLLGSVTAKVLSLASTAVLVYRVKEDKSKRAGGFSRPSVRRPCIKPLLPEGFAWPRVSSTRAALPLLSLLQPDAPRVILAMQVRALGTQRIWPRPRARRGNARSGLPSSPICTQQGKRP